MTLLLRTLLWRLAFDAFNVWYKICPGSGTERYFAYGGNVNPETLRRRKIVPLSSRPYLLAGWHLEFTAESLSRKGIGYASLIQQTGAATPGVLYELKAADAARLDFFEPVPFLKSYVRAFARDGASEFFFYVSPTPKSGLEPMAAYVDRICSAYGSAAEHAEFVARLKSVKTSTQGAAVTGILPKLIFFLYSHSLTEWIVSL